METLRERGYPFAAMDESNNMHDVNEKLRYTTLDIEDEVYAACPRNL